MIEIVRRPYATAFENYATQHSQVICMSADLTSSCEIDGFRDRHPEQFLSMGMAEQNMMSFAGGLAMTGYRPFIHTFGVFTYRRPYDQLIASVAYGRRAVRIMGFLPGITTPGGMTHQAIEDIGIMRAIPNMTVLEAGDATEVESLCEVADTVDGPVYCRVLRGNVPRLFDTPIKFGQMRELSQGGDILVVTAGITTEEVMRATTVLKNSGVSIRHLHLNTLKPFNHQALLDHLQSVKQGVITLENHLVRGGIGSIVEETIAQSGIGKKLIKLGLQDTYAHGGSKAYLMRYYDLDAVSLITAIEHMMGIKTAITEDDLQQAHVEQVHSTAKAEGL